MERAHAGRWMLRIAGAAVIVLSGLVIVNSLPYFSKRRDFAFLEEKGSLVSDPLWRGCFYGHVLGGIVCFLCGPFLLWGRLLARVPRLHRWLGRVYGVAVLGWAAPSGLYLACHAKGGVAGRSAFLLLGILWWGATALGVRAIVARRMPEHRRWMLRSYAVALSAVFFRISHAALFWVGLPDEPNYALSLWFSLAASLVAGEVLIRRSPTGTRSLTLEGVRA
ncbi:MAG TPA: DUF2306 domain-containing protein [Planctomycetota bacterium]|nr:DUF2306 domain-containing protein [Planctomycetota bacterium]